MKATIEVKIKPFQVPSFVRTYEDDDGKSSAIALRELSTETLEQLCQEFTDEVFQKAGKERPQKTAKEFITHLQAKKALEYFDKEFIGQNAATLWDIALNQTNPNP